MDQMPVSHRKISYAYLAKHKILHKGPTGNFDSARLRIVAKILAIQKIKTG